MEQEIKRWTDEEIEEMVKITPEDIERALNLIWEASPELYVHVQTNKFPIEELCVDEFDEDEFNEVDSEVN